MSGCVLSQLVDFVGANGFVEHAGGNSGIPSECSERGKVRADRARETLRAAGGDQEWKLRSSVSLVSCHAARAS